MDFNETIKVLHVEDDAADAELIRSLLYDSIVSGQFEIFRVESLKAALKEIDTGSYDAVILDLHLKDISGMDNVSAIRGQNPDLPIIILSGVDNDKDALSSIDHGAQEYVIKSHCDGKVLKLAIFSSIKRKAFERKLFKLANYDYLTGLANRRMFQNYVEKSIAKASRWKYSEVIMFLDIDNFKSINDEYGHDAGNMLLKEVADRITNLLRKTDIVSRYGGDEFTILLDDRSIDPFGSAKEVASKILNSFEKTFNYNGSDINFSASIGISIYPESGEDYMSLIKFADDAMYNAKHLGGGQFCFYSAVTKKVVLV